MARLNSAGLDDVLEEMSRLGELSGETAERMILAGAEEVKQAWQRIADERGHRDTGAMIDSIGYPREPKNIEDALTLDIYPQGRDARGVRNAEKAFILHYGSSRIQGDHWVDAAEDAAEDPMQAAMEEIWDEFITERS